MKMGGRWFDGFYIPEHELDHNLERILNKITDNKVDTILFKIYTRWCFPYRMIETLKTNDSVEKFDICPYRMGNELATSIFEFLEKRKNIKEIKLLHICDDENINIQNDNFEMLKIFVKLLDREFLFKNFIIEKSKIGFRGAEVLAANLVNNNFLKKLDLQGNEIGDDGVKLLLESLAISGTIEIINLAKNKLTDQTTIYIKQFLEINQLLI